MGSGKRFAVLLCAEDSDYVKKRYGGYYGVFVDMLAEEGETWDVFKKVLGICFGHQILCRALGGKTGRAISGWDIGLTTVHLSPSSSKLFSSLKIPTTLSIIECHRDEVREPPPKAEVIAWSEKTGVEMFRYGDHMMGIQGHPEYTKDILIHLIDRLLRRNFITDSYTDELKANLGKVEPDKDAWKKLCTSFLKGRL
ncbi:hypothetical protein like AT2G23970 [Hibiscus trionum]|uniref:Glutamine amidotransferase domain-containing protein n=1 Tax=Hibiscus trionum TaxID=183268 RepID=A0A9W7MIS7_HIBTR|nr:hypothetical protein like AT2G23970 [Hibiscus trionum]